MSFYCYRPVDVQFHYTNRVEPSVLGKCFISSRAFLVMVHGAALASANRRNTDENGFFLYGTYFHEEDGSIVVCVDDATDGGPRSRASRTTYCFDEAYVNHRLGFMADSSCEKNRTAVGIVHIHPGSMDYFSHVDIETFITKLLPDTRFGLLTGLINIDPALRITMYFIRREENGYACYNVPVLVSDEEVNKRVDFSRPRSVEMVWEGVTGRCFPGTSVPIASETLRRLTLHEPEPAPAPAFTCTADTVGDNAKEAADTDAPDNGKES